MARSRRFKPDPDFHMAVSRAAIGIEATARGSVRRRRTTLAEVGEAIVEEAKAITDSEAEGLPSVTTGGRRNTGYDFRREDRRGKTYRASFRWEVRREAGRLIIVVINDHPHAADVEYGNGPGGAEVEIERPGGRYFAIPITRSAYNRMKKRHIPDPASRERARARANLRYWEQRGKDLTKQRREFQRQVRNFRNPEIKSRITEEELRERAGRLAANISQARAAKLTARANIRRLPEPRRPKSFPTIAPNGRTYLYSRSFRTYSGYGILRRAMRRVTLRTLE